MKRHQLSTGILAAAMAVGAAVIPSAAQSQQSRTGDTHTTWTTPLAAGNTFEGIATIDTGRGQAVHRFVLKLPHGASLQPVPSETGESELASEILVKDRNGNVMGVVDSPWAQDADGNALFTFFRIEGQTVVQTIDTSAAGGKPVTAVLMYAGSKVAADAAGMTREPATPGDITIQNGTYVSVPSNYVYNPSLGSLHDYCTSSPDEFPNPVGDNASFRGPCARHDLCYAGSTSEWTCDVNLRENMRMNCRHWYAWYNPVRGACYDTANIYFAAVVAAS